MPPIAFGLNTTKKPNASKAAPPKRKPAFGAFSNNDSDDEDTSATKGGAEVQEIGGDLDDFDTPTQPSQETSRRPTKTKNGAPPQPPKLKSKHAQPNTMFGDLSSTLTSKRESEAASTLDPSVYEYDAVYDSLKPAKPAAAADKDRKPRYMRGLMEAADVRKRDALIAEEKKVAREREAEGDEFAGKEKFVTEAYKKQQEENKRIEEEERKREEAEGRKNAGGGMSGFYKDLLKKEGERHSEVVKAVEETAKDAPTEKPEEEEKPEDEEEAKRVKEMQAKGAELSINEEGQVVDKRQLLKGGLNLGAKPKAKPQADDNRPVDRERRPLSGQQIGSRQAQRERQSRMMAEQLEASLKRNRDEEEEKKEEVERQAKSRKTEGDISSAKERYLARKRAAEEAKKGES